MKSRLVSAAFAFVLGFSTAIGQTAKDIEAKYGKPANVYPLSGKVYYSMSEHVLLRPVYGADGQVCLMQLYPKGIHPDESHPDDALAVDEVLKIINELVPPATRGARTDLFGGADLGGGIARTHFKYEHVVFTFISYFRLENLPDKQLGEPLDFDFDVDERALAEARRKEALRPDDELIRERASKPKVVEIRWTNRKCVEP